MSDTIWKYDLTPPPGSDRVELHIPTAHKILTVQTQNGRPTMWAWVVTDTPTTPVFFLHVGTGHRVPELLDLSYIATWQSGEFVFHTFKVNRPPAAWTTQTKETK